MDPERWKRIDEIFHAVLQREPSERAEFLVQACEGDDVLRLEIEGLLESHEKESSLFENPAVDLAAEVLAKREIHQGNIAHYRILKKIGSGGMGEVYLAEDSHLNRNVAIKVLPIEFSKDKEKIKRFEREARALSALNHPYILTVHDIGKIDSSIFIASEYIEGETLRNRMRSGRIPLKEVLTVIIQVAEALDAAHQVGIIHRDIKPENIMLRRDGYVKVLDFGLSKSIEDEPLTEVSTLKTLSQTEKGVILGTVRYMSPEQARGLRLDARSDLFSLGIVFYEMIAGRVPFEGSTGSDVLAAILEKNPASLRIYGDFPERLQWVLSKLLEKDPEERYQSAKDLLTDLKRIRKQLDVEEELKRSEPSEVVRMSHNAKKKTLILVPLLLIVLGAIGLFIFRENQTPQLPKIPFQKTKLVRLTSSGKVLWGAISPDGKYFAYTQDIEERPGLYIRQLAAGSEIKLLNFTGSNPYESPRFFPDGEYIYYLTWSWDEELGRLYQIPVLGGLPRKVVEDVDSSPAFSPDGKKMAFIRNKNKESMLMIANVDGKSERKIASRKDPQSYGLLDWSPDGETIALILRTHSPSGYIMQIVGIDLTGSQRFLSGEKWIHEWGQADLKWVPDGSGLLISKGTAAHQIYYMSYPQGKLNSITNDPNDYRSISITKDAKFLLTKKYAYSATIWTAPSSKPDSIDQVTWGTDIDDGSTGLSWKPDGKILFHSDAPSGETQIWFMNSNGSDRIRITTGNDQKYWPVASPDGRYIVYNALEGESLKLWRIDSNGDNPKLLTARSARFPKISPDNKWILCSTLGEDKQQLLKISIDGSKETILASHQFIIGQAISPDGKQIAYVEEDSKTSNILLNVLSSEGGDPIKEIRLEDDVLTGGRFQWTPDGSGVAYIRNQKGVSNIYVTPVDGSPGRYLTNFTEGSIHNFAWSYDGKQIAYSRVVRTTDIVLLQDIP